VFYNGCNYIGSAAQFTAFAAQVFAFKLAPDADGDAAAAGAEFAAWLEASRPRTFCYLDVGAAGAGPLGRLVVELFDDLCPKTAENFRGICEGAEGKEGGEALSYSGTPIHRVVKGGWIQAGDTSAGGSGTGGASIFGATFEDESFEVPHDRPGIIGMANSGPHTNASQFYITKNAAPWLNQKKGEGCGFVYRSSFGVCFKGLQGARVRRVVCCL
jgi:cyclophilin family peptidyl-prolyl cis-trans isomerase